MDSSVVDLVCNSLWHSPDPLEIPKAAHGYILTGNKSPKVPLGEVGWGAELLIGQPLSRFLSTQTGVLGLHLCAEDSLELGKGVPGQGVSSPSPAAAGP